MQVVCALSACTPAWLTNLTQCYESDPLAQQLLQQLALEDNNEKGYSLTEGVIRYKGRTWIGNNEIAQQHVIQSMHSNGIGGRSGFYATYQRIKQLFAWPKMKEAIKKYIQSCVVCQQAKTERVKLPGLLQPLPMPDQAWTVVSMDFIEGLPSSYHYNAILVVIDKFMKYAHFIPLADPFTTLHIAQLYMDHIYRLHGLPQVIITDRDKIFTSALWQNLFKLSDTQLHMSSAYHPQSDG